MIIDSLKNQRDRLKASLIHAKWDGKTTLADNLQKKLNYIENQIKEYESRAANN